MYQVTLTKRFKDVSLGLSFFINNRCFASTELPNAFMGINFVVIGLGKRRLQNQSNLSPDDGKWILRQWKNARYLPLLFSNVQLWCIWKTYTVIGWLIDLVLSSVGLFFLCTYGTTSLQLFANGITDTILDDQENNTKRNYNPAESFISHRRANFQFDSEDHKLKVK